MIQSIVRRRRTALVAALSIELILAGWWRWGWTIAPIETAFDYGSGHVAVVSENWRRSGAFRQHFLPVMSIDRELPEWPYRTEFAQEYSSVPPLAFILHYAATRLFPRVEAILVAKLLAQALTAASVLAAAWLLASVFDAWSIFLGLSFLISGVPFLLWYSNGYFAVNVGVAATLVLTAWCADVAARSLDPSDDRVLDRRTIAAGALLAFVGAFADYMPIAANATAAIGLFERDRRIRLPLLDDEYEGRPVRLGGEDARAVLAGRGGDVYVAYDPEARTCQAEPVPLAVPDRWISIAACRAPARAVVNNFESVLPARSGGYECTGPPTAPGDLRVVVNHAGTVVVSWSPSATTRSLYVLEAGRTSGRADALTAEVGRSTTFSASNVQHGTYYVRVRGRNGCGTGAPSNELIVEVE